MRGNFFEKNVEQERKTFIEKGNYTPVNEIVSYGITNENSFLNIHIAPATDFNAIEKIRLLEDGLKKLAAIVNSNKNIEMILAASWIVLKKQKLVESLGFKIADSLKIQMLIDSERIKKSSPRPAALAYMSREDFIERYFKD